MGEEGLDVGIARELVAEAADGRLHLYGGSAHLFADEDSPEFDEAAAHLMLERALAFLERIKAGGSRAGA